MPIINAYDKELSLCFLGHVKNRFYVTCNLKPQHTQIQYAMVTRPVLYAQGWAVPDYRYTGRSQHRILIATLPDLFISA